MPVLSPFLAFAVTIAAGASATMQQVVNARLRGEIGSPWWAGFISYFVGMVAMLFVALAVEGLKSPASVFGRINGFSWTGGMFGAIFVSTAVLMVPRLGLPRPWA
ncbi:DMT family transporter [Novosphingobium kaempferiae]|uniref:DMT family transporter n=1 Tax=Novosphingobium kaempferiae TaxID=2896849 RepID=UPI0021051C15|nr:DMT family transporter [Novosphingobium kaempferiae]